MSYDYGVGTVNVPLPDPGEGAKDGPWITFEPPMYDTPDGQMIYNREYWEQNFAETCNKYSASDACWSSLCPDDHGFQEGEEYCRPYAMRSVAGCGPPIKCPSEFETEYRYPKQKMTAFLPAILLAGWWLLR